MSPDERIIALTTALERAFFKPLKEPELREPQHTEQMMGYWCECPNGSNAICAVRIKKGSEFITALCFTNYWLVQIHSTDKATAPVMLSQLDVSELVITLANNYCERRKWIEASSLV